MATTARSTVEIQMALKGAAQIRGGIAGITADTLRAQSQLVGFNARLASANTSLMVAAQKAAASTRQMTQASGFARHELQNLAFQSQDIVVGLTSGQKPLTVLMQQGSQVAQILMASQVTMGGFFRQLATGAVAAARPVGILAAAVGALATAWTALRASLAEANADKALASLGESNRKLGDSILGQLDGFVKRGEITAERAHEIAADIRNAFTDGFDRLDPMSKMPLGSGGLNATDPRLVSDLLMGMSRELRAKLPPQLTQAALVAHREAGLARVEAEKDIQDQLAKMNLEGLQATYQAGDVPLQGYLARRRQLATESHNREIETIKAQDHDLRLRILAADADEKKQLAVSAHELLAKRRQAEIEFAAELNRITAEGVKERERIEQEAAAKRAEDLARRRQAFELDLHTAGADWRLSDQERYAQQRQKIAQAMEAGTVDAGEGNLLVQALGPDPTSFVDNFAAGVARLRSEWGSLAQTMASGALQTVGSIVNGLSGALTSLAMGTQKAGAAFAQFGIQVATGFVSMVLQAILWATLAVPLLTALSTLMGGTPAAVGGPTTIAAVGTAVAGVGAMTAREAGGNMTARLPYLVGERRAEVIVPREDSMVYPSLGAFQAEQNSRTAGETAAGNSRAAVYLVDDRKKAHKERLRRGDYDAEILDVNQRNRTSQGY